MELVVILLIGLLFGGGLWLILQRRLLKVVFGTTLISHGTLLLTMTMGRLKAGRAPILREGYAGPYVDPIPQALNLTAIVIGFATTALILTLTYRIFAEHETDDLEQLRGVDDEAR